MLIERNNDLVREIAVVESEQFPTSEPLDHKKCRAESGPSPGCILNGWY
jgi:hypothetical protein